MTRIDFYFNVEDKFRYLAELAAKALVRQRRLFVFVPDVEVAESMGHTLWTHVPTSFLPHCLGKHALSPESPIVIDWKEGELLHDDILVNLRPECPPFFSRFQGLIELVGRDESDRVVARERFRFYRDRGYEIRSHDIAGIDHGQ